MYSLVLMMAMSSPADVPQGLLFNRGSGCNGTKAQPVRAFVADVNEARPHLLSRFFHRSSGCGGSQVAVATVSTVTVRSTGCAGSSATVAAMQPVAAAQPMQAGGLITRIAVHRQLRLALGNAYRMNLSPDQFDAVRTALQDSDIYEAAVTKVHRDLGRQLAAKGGTVGAFGDGHLLQLLIQNMPQIIAAIKQIIALFGPHALLVPVHDWAPLPAGPYPPASVRVPHWLAC